MKYSLTIALCVLSFAQQPSSLASFFEKRLSDKHDAPVPPYESLLRVVDTIGKSERSAIASTMPLLRSALRSSTPNLSIEAVFVLVEISRRPDGGQLLRESVSDLTLPLMSPDERLSGGAVTVLRNLTASIPEATTPILLSELKRPVPPSLVKAEILRTLIEPSRRNDDQVQRSIETYLSMEASSPVKTANLHAIGATRFASPAAVQYVVNAMEEGDKQVQIAAIQTSYSLGVAVRDRVRPIVSKWANSPNSDPDLRSMAQRFLQNKLADPYTVPEPPPPNP